MTTAVATKDDLIQLENKLLNKIGGIRAYVDQSALETRMYIDGKMEQQFQRFQVVAENLVYDFRGAHTDKISQHEDRILTLERHTGLKNA